VESRDHTQGSIDLAGKMEEQKLGPSVYCRIISVVKKSRRRIKREFVSRVGRVYSFVVQVIHGASVWPT
jgi:hypothetical protein